MEMGEELEFRLRMISQEVLDFAVLDEDLARLESMNATRDRFYFYYKLLTEEEIIKLVKIVSEFYRNFLDSNINRLFVNEVKPELNSQTEASAEFVRTVINLEGTVMHKFLLLTSGKRILTDDNLDLLIHLAKNKSGDYSSTTTKPTYKPFCNYSENLYIIPGITDKTVMLNASEAESYITFETYFEHTLRVMAFVAEDSTLTLAEFEKLDLLESISTKRPLKALIDFNESRRILTSPRYASFAESLTASELRSLAMILDKKSLPGNFPYEFLRNRVKSMAARSKRTEVIDLKGIFGYLSDEEMLTDDLSRFTDELEAHMRVIQIKGNFMPAAWAAFAELFAVRGKEKVLEVARTISKDVNGRQLSVKLYQSIVMLILEGLKPEAVDYPFSWFAQFSEHAWVLSPNSLESVVA